jgi:hypothetical protein
VKQCNKHVGIVKYEGDACPQCDDERLLQVIIARERAREQQAPPAPNVWHQVTEGKPPLDVDVLVRARFKYRDTEERYWKYRLAQLQETDSGGHCWYKVEDGSSEGELEFKPTEWMLLE